MIEKLIITLTEHAVWGSVLQPVLVSEDASGCLTILEIVGSKSTFFAHLTSLQKELVLMSEKVSDKVLMKNYSKEKNLVEFYKKLSSDTQERYIRPNIEDFHRRVINALEEAELEIYLRLGVKTRVLYDSDRVEVLSGPAQVVFNFKKEQTDGLHYSISLKSDNRELDLFSQSYFSICSEPAALIINRRLYTFTDIDIKKLTPFFSKRHIQVPATSEKTYIKTFVKNCVEKYEVNATGISIQQFFPARKALLSLEHDWNMVPVLHLRFQYDERIFTLDSANKKHVLPREEDDQVALHWFYPDKSWENSLIESLIRSGLKRSSVGHFVIQSPSEDEDGAQHIESLLKWIQIHGDLLEKFEFTQNISEKRYFIGEISVSTQVESRQDWFDIHAEAVFGEFRIPFIKFRNHILNNIYEYVLPDNTVAVLPREWFSRFFELMLFSKKADENIQLQKHHFAIVDALHHRHFVPDDSQLISDTFVPQGIQAELRSYQMKGFRWLVHLYKNNFGGCLADDMGLGKTLQTITLIQHLKNTKKLSTHHHKQHQAALAVEASSPNGQLTIFDIPAISSTPDFSSPVDEYYPSLIVMPTSLIHNWQNEFSKFAPGLKVYVYSGAKRLKSKDINRIFNLYDVVLTTYGTLRNDIEMFIPCTFHHLILDESQYVKNPDSLSYKAVKQVNALHKLALTGTPVENSLTDLWAQINIVNEGLLGNQSSFRNVYIHQINKNNKAKEEALLKIIKPFILRRTKEEVAPELPPLWQETVYCDMSEDQQRVYNQEKSKLRNSLMLSDANFDPKKMAFLTLQGLTRLRLLANHPVLVDAAYPADSGKMEQIIMRFETLRSENHKVLIFSSFVKHLRLLAEYFDKENWKYSWLSGATPAASREQEIEKFKSDPDVNCFFISLKAGGVGLNLTSADYVFIIDPWWNPASEMQALSRSHRIGQDKKVMVYRFISSTTIEEKIRDLQENKSKLAETFITSTNPLRDMNKEEVAQLFE